MTANISFEMFPLVGATKISQESLLRGSIYSPSNFGGILEAARRHPDWFINEHEKAPLIMHIVGSNIATESFMKELIEAVLSASQVQIQNIKARDDRTLLHAISLCPPNQKKYILEMFCFLVGAGLDPKLPDKSGCSAGEYLLKRSKDIRFHAEVMRASEEALRTRQLKEIRCLAIKEMQRVFFLLKLYKEILHSKKRGVLY